jgi:LysR family transcriptional regulator of abg operon
MPLSLAQLRQFVALAEAGSVGGAARALGVSQPAATKSLRALEAQLGTVLIRRTARGTELTKHGQTFLLRARSACREIDRGQAELAEALKQVSGPVVLGASPASAAALLPGPLKLLRRDFPVDIRIIEGMPGAMLPRVRDESLDFALGPSLRTPLASDLVAVPLSASPFRGGRRPRGAPARTVNAAMRRRDVAQRGVALLRGIAQADNPKRVISGLQVAITAGALAPPWPVPELSRSTYLGPPGGDRCSSKTTPHLV